MTRHLATAALFVLLSCASWPRGFLFQDTTFPVVCTTACNLKLLGPNPGGVPLPAAWTCDALQNVEDRVITMLRSDALIARDPRFLHACPTMAGWDIDVDPTKKNLQTFNGLEGGDASCSQRRIFLGNSPPADGALAHELVHVAQSCKPRDDGKVYQDQHLDWAPIYAALKAAGFQAE